MSKKSVIWDLSLFHGFFYQKKPKMAIANKLVYWYD